MATTIVYSIIAVKLSIQAYKAVKNYQSIKKLEEEIK